MTKNDRYSIDVLDAALDIVELLRKTEGRPQGASEVGNAVGISRNRAFRILKTLEHRDFVEPDPRTRGYRLSTRFLDIAEDIRGRINLQVVSKSVLDELAWTTGETANLMARYGNTAVLVERRLGSHRLQVEEPIGNPYPLYIGAAPKILLAYLPVDKRNHLIEAMELVANTPHTITDKVELRRRLTQILRLGYAIDEEELEIGACAIGVPVRDHQGRVIAAISISLPKVRFNRKHNRDLVRHLSNAADRLSALLSWHEAEHLGDE